MQNTTDNGIQGQTTNISSPSEITNEQASFEMSTDSFLDDDGVKEENVTTENDKADDNGKLTNVLESESLQETIEHSSSKHELENPESNDAEQYTNPSDTQMKHEEETLENQETTVEEANEDIVTQEIKKEDVTNTVEDEKQEVHEEAGDESKTEKDVVVEQKDEEKTEEPVLGDVMAEILQGKHEHDTKDYPSEKSPVAQTKSNRAERQSANNAARSKTRQQTRHNEISIDNYDRNKPCTFTEAETLEAMKLCGIEPKELFMPTQAQLSRYPDDPEIRKMVLDHHHKRIDGLVAMISEQRENLFKGPKSHRSESGASGGTDDMYFVSLERKRLERAQAFQKRGAEAMVIQALREQERVRKAQEREEREKERMKKAQEERAKASEDARKRHLERLKELEKQDAQKRKAEEEKRREQFERSQRLLKFQQDMQEEKAREMKANEQIRREKAEKNRKYLADIEAERKKKIRDKEAASKKREEKRLQALREERERRKEESDAKTHKREEQMKRAKIHEQERIEKLRKDGNFREREQERRVKEYQEQRNQKQAEYAERQKQKMERNAERRKEIDKETLERKQKLCTTDADLDRRWEKIKEAREFQSLQARTNRSDAAMRSLQKFKEYQELQRKKKEEADRQMAKAEENYQKVRDEQKRQALIKAMGAQLKQEEREANARHIDNLRQAKVEQLRKRQEETDARIRKQQKEQERIQVMRRNTVSKMDQERSSLESQFRETLRHSDRSEAHLEQIAKKYDLDMNELREKAKRRSAGIPLVRPVSGSSNTHPAND